jgi:hypothetical protein
MNCVLTDSITNSMIIELQYTLSCTALAPRVHLGRRRHGRHEYNPGVD